MCGYCPSIALGLTLEGELRARFGSGAVMCFYCSALKYIFSFLPRALSLSGSLSSVSHSVWAMKIFCFFLVFALLFWAPLRTTLPGISLAMLTQVVSGWVLSPPWSCPPCSVSLSTDWSGMGGFPLLRTWQGEIFLSLCFYLISLTLLALTWWRADRRAWVRAHGPMQQHSVMRGWQIHYPPSHWLRQEHAAVAPGWRVMPWACGSTTHLQNVIFFCKPQIVKGVASFLSFATVEVPRWFMAW